MGDEEWKVKREETVVLKSGVHTQEDLVNFMIAEQSIREPFDNV